MNQDQEAKWREEFDVLYTNAPELRAGERHIAWQLYLSACKKRQEEIVKLKADLVKLSSDWMRINVDSENKIQQLKEELKRERECVDSLINQTPHYEDCDSEDPDDEINCNCGRNLDIKLARQTQAQRKIQL